MSRIPKDYKPTVDEVNKYINKWNGLDNYVNQEKALDYLFGDKCRYNNDIREVLIKCCTLNDFYSTNIFDIHSVAQHILKLDIDERLEKGDLSLVNDIAHVEVGNPNPSLIPDNYFQQFLGVFVGITVCLSAKAS